MEKSRRIKILSIFTLVLALVSMSLGFAAFSTTLNISSSANVIPNSDDFKLKMVGIDGDNKFKILSSSIEGSEDGIISDDGQSVTGINVVLSKPGDYVIYGAYVDNVGEYDAYFQDFIVDNIEGYSVTKRCTPIDDVNLELLNAACPNIGFQLSVIDVDDEDNSLATVEGEENEDYYMAKGSRHLLRMRYIYLADAVYVDGAFNMEIGVSRIIYGSAPKS